MSDRARSSFRSVTHVLFDIGVVLKGIDGVVQIVGAALLFFVSREHIIRIVEDVTRGAPFHDPRDAIARRLLAAAHGLSVNAKTFAATYLFVHGVVKVGLVAALLRGKHWAYPIAIGVFAVFGVYQVYRYVVTGSPWMLALTILDVLVIALTWLEYERRFPGPV